MDKYEAVVRDSTMCRWRDQGGSLIAAKKSFWNFRSLPRPRHQVDLDSEGYLDLDLGLGMFNKDEFHRGVLVGLCSSCAPKILMEGWRLFVLAREKKCESFTSQQRTSSPGKA